MQTQFFKSIHKCKEKKTLKSYKLRVHAMGAEQVCYSKIMEICLQNEISVRTNVRIVKALAPRQSKLCVTHFFTFVLHQQVEHCNDVNDKSLTAIERRSYSACSSG